MRFLAALVAYAIITGTAYCTTFTSTQSGNINDGGTFGNSSPGVQGTDFPGANDNVVIKAATRLTVPFSYNVTIGSITFQDGGTAANHTALVVSSSGTGLTITGNVTMGQAAGNSRNEVQLTSSAVLNLNGFNWVMGAGGTSRNYLWFLGNSAGSVTVNGGGGSFTQGAQGGFDILSASWTLVNFSSMATTGLAYATAGHNFIMSSCTWINSAQLTIPQNQATPADNIYIENSDFRGTTISPGIRFRASLAGAVPSGRNEFVSNTVSSNIVTNVGVIIQVDATSVTFRNNVFQNWQIQGVGTFGTGQIIKDNIMIATQAVNADVFVTTLGSSTIQNNYFYAEGDNPHFWLGNGTRTIYNNVVETNTQGTITDDGDIYLANASAAESSGTVSHNIVLGTRNSSVLLSMQLAAISTDSTNMYNNTSYRDKTTSVTHDCNRVGETYAGRASMFPMLDNMLCVVSSSDTAAFIIRDQTVGISQKIVTGDYNASWNVAGTKYQLVGTYGTHDIQVDPNFIDNTRNFTKWDTFVGGPGTSADAITKLLQSNGYGGAANSAYNLTSLLNYVRTGFTPQAQVLKGAGFDGSDIGAMAVIPPTGFFASGL